MTKNERTAPGQKRLRKYLQIIGEGRYHSKEQINKLFVPKQLLVETLDQLISFCFPQRLFIKPLENADVIADTAILCPTNLDVKAVNEKMHEKMVGESKLYKSIDTPLDLTEAYGTYRSDFNIKAINLETPSGLPPHELNLKVKIFLLYINIVFYRSGRPSC